MPAAHEVVWELPDRCDSHPLSLCMLLTGGNHTLNGGLSLVGLTTPQNTLAETPTVCLFGLYLVQVMFGAVKLLDFFKEE